MFSHHSILQRPACGTFRLGRRVGTQSSTRPRADRYPSTIIKELKLPTEPVESAKEAGLRHVTDAVPGISRLRRGKNFVYTSPDGKIIKDREELLRIQRFVIPPAWTEVWICCSPNGHLQATGRDARRRKQYRYHTRWREVKIRPNTNECLFSERLFRKFVDGFDAI